MNDFKWLGAAVLALAASTSAQAFVVATDTSAASLAAAVLGGDGGGLTLVGTPLLSGHATSSGTYTNASGTYSISDGIILSSGDVADYGDGPNTLTENTTAYGIAATAAQDALLDPITGGTLDHFDVTQLDLSFTTSTGSVIFNVVFGSDEFDEFVGSSFIDAFGVYLDGTNIAFYLGQSLNINHAAMDFRAGTELDGVLPGSGVPMLFSASGLDLTAIHTLTFIIADSGDPTVDSTAYIGGLGGGALPPPGAVPTPATLGILGAGLIGLAGLRRRQAA